MERLVEPRAGELLLRKLSSGQYRRGADTAPLSLMNKPAKYLFSVSSIDFGVRAHRDCLTTAPGKDMHAEVPLLPDDHYSYMHSYNVMRVVCCMTRANKSSP